jgi:N-acetylmuramic acid 6-phosphate (MurNAc-6-P) etherase
MNFSDDYYKASQAIIVMADSDIKAAADLEGKTVSCQEGTTGEQYLLDEGYEIQSFKTGAEAISGSTRMKAGTAHKMILNMLSTASMVKIGKTYHNLMIDEKPTNEKLKRRAIAIVSEIAQCKDFQSKEVLEEFNYNIKHAVLHIMYDLTYEQADKLLKENNGILRRAFEHLHK